MANRERRSIKLSEARSTFSALINDVYRSHDRVVVEKSGIPVAVLVSVSDLERLERHDAERAERFNSLNAYSAEFAGVSPKEIDRQAEQAVAEARQEIATESAHRKSA
jgi:prevent-host-death family protein